MTEMALMVVTHAEINDHWADMSPLVERCINKAYNGEMRTEDVRTLILEQKAFAIVGFKDGRIVVVSVFEAVIYPRMKTISCILLAGNSKDLMRELDAQHMEQIRAYARTLGADAIECLASDPMTQMLKRMGYAKIYNVCRMQLR